MAKESQKKKDQNLKNLKPFEKGQSGNKNGAPKGKRLTTILNKLIDQNLKAQDPLTRKKVDKTLAEWLCIKLIAAAVKGKSDIKAMKIIFDRIEGKVPDNLNVNTNDAALEFLKDKIRKSNQSDNEDENES